MIDTGKIKLITLILFTLFLLKCGIYGYTSQCSFHETSTISVSKIKNNIKTHSPSIDYEITEKLQEKLSRQEDLELVKKDGFLQFSGSIVNYNIKPVYVGSNNEPSRNRVRITLNLSLLSQVENNKITNEIIAAFVDYNANLNFGQVKDSLNNILSIKVANEIYNKFFIR